MSNCEAKTVVSAPAITRILFFSMKFGKSSDTVYSNYVFIILTKHYNINVDLNGLLLYSDPGCQSRNIKGKLGLVPEHCERSY
jgi:hypothetical protein